MMDNVPYEEWRDYICAILRRHGIMDGLLLDLGCGTGTFTELLADQGYDMIGIDQSEDMLALAMEKRTVSGHEILYLCQDMREFELYGTVRGIVSICDCMNYLTCEEDFLQVLKLAENYLDYDGLFVFDLNTLYKYEALLADQTFAENRENCSFIWENTYDRESCINEYALTLFVRDTAVVSAVYDEAAQGVPYLRFCELHYQRAYSISNVIEMIDRSGLILEGLYCAGSFEEPDDVCERVCFVTRKRLAP